VMSVALKHLNEVPPPPRMYNPDLPPPVEAVIMRALDKDPQRRPATGAELARNLENAFGPDITHIPEGVATPSVTDMLDSSPSAPSSDAQARVGSTITPPPASYAADDGKPDSGLSALAGRFARRRQQKADEAALQSLSADELEIDEDTLGSILEHYADPRDIGLVGPDATGITLPERPDDSRITPDGEKPRKRERRRRRVRVGVLLPLALVLAVLAGAVWFGTRDSDDGGDSDAGIVLSTRERTQTATFEAATRSALLAVANEMATANAEASATQRAAATATRPSTATVEGASGGATEAPTDTPSATPTVEPTDTATATATASATLTVTPSATATTAPTVTLTAAATVPAAEVTGTEPGTPVVMLTGPEPNVRLMYDAEQFLLINISDQTLDVSQLLFVQELPNGTTLSFRTANWNRSDITDPTDELRSGGCYQLLTADATQMPPDEEVCPQFLGYFRSVIANRYFWLSDEPGAVFTVRDLSTDIMLGTCLIEAGDCAFYVGPDAVEMTPTPRIPTAVPQPTVAATPTPTVATTGDMRMIYDDDSFLIVNVSDRELDISQLVFEQELPDSAVRRFEAQGWNRSDVVRPPSQMSVSGCYQLVTGDGTQVSPSRDVCLRFLGWFRTGVARRYFWLSDQPGAVFTVRDAATDTIIGTCPIEPGTCLISLPVS